MFEALVPEDIRSDIPSEQAIDDKLTKKILQRVAEKYPEKYRDISFGLLKLGAKASVETSTSFSLADLKSPIDKKALIDKAESEEIRIFNDKSLSPKAKQNELIKLYAKLGETTPSLSYEGALAAGSNLAKMVASGARGNKGQLNSSIGADWLILDSEDNPVPVPIKRNYSEGLSPAEYWASAAGTRKGLTAVKLATRDAGFLCLDADTLVRMADGSTKKIKDIVPGDVVLGADKNGQTFPSKVVRKYDNGVKDVNRYAFRCGEAEVFLDATEDHKVLARFGRRQEQLPLSKVKRKSFSAIPRRDQFRHNFPYLGHESLGQRQTFDIEVDNEDHLFVLENGMIVSNSKQLASAAINLVVTTDDCGSKIGIPVAADDPDNIGAILSKPVAGVLPGTPITPKVLSQIRASGAKNIVVRSPITCNAEQGLCSLCCGIRERNALPSTMDNVGLSASSALGEPLAQGALCLAKGTKVRMADWSVKNIEDIAPGDCVLGANKNGQTFPSLVQDRFINGERDCSRFSFSNPDGDPVVLESTLDHKILSIGGTILPVGTEDDDFAALLTSRTWILRKSIEPLGLIETFDIQVDNEDHLFVLENGLVVSNSTKHGGGVASSTRKASGFQQINALAQIPSVYPDGAPVAEEDGQVTKVEKAPQGGWNVFVNETRHYVPSNQQLLIKPGAKLESGDPLSDGVVSPADVTRHKGVGEGRMYFVNAMRQAFKDNGLFANRRNLEVLARAVVNHVQVDDPDGVGDFLPDDVVEYGALERSYQKPKSTVKLPIKKAVGQYLQSPVLHYSIGTRITPSVAQTLEENDESEVEVAPEAPPFKPKMVRLMENPTYRGDDWMTKLTTSYVKDSLITDTLSGRASSDIHGTSPYPGLALGTEFGKKTTQKGEKGKVGY